MGVTSSRQEHELNAAGEQSRNGIVPSTTENILASSSEITHANGKGEPKTIVRHPSYQSNVPADSLVPERKAVMAGTEQPPVASTEDSDDVNTCRSRLLFCNRIRWRKINITRSGSRLINRQKSVTLDHGNTRAKPKRSTSKLQRITSQTSNVEGAMIEYDYEDLHIQIKRIDEKTSESAGPGSHLKIDSIPEEEEPGNTNAETSIGIDATQKPDPPQENAQNTAGTLQINDTPQPSRPSANDDKNLTQACTSEEAKPVMLELPVEITVEKNTSDLQNTNQDDSNATPPDPQPAADETVQKELRFKNEPILDQVTFQSSWRQTVRLRSLYEAGCIEESTIAKLISGEYTSTDEIVADEIHPWIDGNDPIAGIILMETGEKMSLFKAAKAGIIRRGTAVALLEAQAATGNIICPITGRKLSVKEATELGLLDKLYESVVNRAERAVNGYSSRLYDGVINLFNAMKRKLVLDAHAMRLMEVQLATGGIIDPILNIRTPLAVAIERDLIDSTLADTLQGNGLESEFKMFYDPNTEENVCYQELMSRCVVDEDSGLRLMVLELPVNQRRRGNRSGASSRAGSRRSSAYTSRTGSLSSIPDTFKYNYGTSSAKILSQSIAKAVERVSENAAAQAARRSQAASGAGNSAVNSSARGDEGKTSASKDDGSAASPAKEALKEKITVVAATVNRSENALQAHATAS